MPRTIIAIWNGNDFQPLGAGINATISSVAVLNGTIYAGGAALSGNYTDVGVWNGTQWVFENAFSGNAPALNVLFAHGGVLYAAGVTMGFAGSMHHVMMRGPGGEWQSIGNTLNGPVRALAWHNGHLVAGGAFTAMQNAGGTNLNHVALFDGSDWAPLGVGLPDAVNTLLDFNDVLYAGGHIREDGTPRSGLARFGAANTWDMLMPNANDYIGAGPLSVEVNTLAQHGTDLFLGGDFQITQDGATGMGVAKFTGTADGFVPYANLDGPVRALVCRGAFELIAGGAFQGNGNGSVPHIGYTILATGMEKPASPLQFGLYPNPAGYRLTIATEGLAAGMRIELVDASGALVSAAVSGPAAKPAVLDISDLSPGRYVVRLLTPDGPATRPFVKQ